MDEVHSTVQIPPLFEELTSDKSMQDIILHRIRHGMVNSSRLSFYLGLFSPEDNFGSFSSDSFELGDQNVVFDPGIFFINGVFSFKRKTPHLLSNNFMFDKCHILREISLMIESSVKMIENGAKTDCEWKAQARNICVASFDWTCSGIGHPVDRIKEVHRRCGIAVEMMKQDKARKLLAEVLCKGLQDNRRVILIGFSRGAREIFKPGIVERVVLLGVPFARQDENWIAATKGKLLCTFNLYNRTLDDAQHW
ncbi:reverse transcriptase domain-containing protein [Tanacetum coccineum]